ncbi:Membrane magnesium transporter 1 [Holothuria leucospilota]|uniref:Membrane magnesium transporter n=1 Tax=Holothuria leucospilota TaxID=206669 RepID=A0A9Q1BRJ9_HOLLE|nr:Membrane magnesium transporter 1 [Holothuria leucospilota]
MPPPLYGTFLSATLWNSIPLHICQAENRSYIRLTEQEFNRLPADIVIECFVSLIVTCYGVINMAGKFKGIRAMADFQNKSMDTVGNRPSFYHFAHRGTKLYAGEPEEER